MIDLISQSVAESKDQMRFSKRTFLLFDSDTFFLLYARLRRINLDSTEHKEIMLHCRGIFAAGQYVQMEHRVCKFIWQLASKASADVLMFYIDYFFATPYADRLLTISKYHLLSNEWTTRVWIRLSISEICHRVRLVPAKYHLDSQQINQILNKLGSCWFDCSDCVFIFNKAFILGADVSDISQLIDRFLAEIPDEDEGFDYMFNTVFSLICDNMSYMPLLTQLLRLGAKPSDQCVLDLSREKTPAIDAIKAVLTKASDETDDPMITF